MKDWRLHLARMIVTPISLYFGIKIWLEDRKCCKSTIKFKKDDSLLGQSQLLRMLRKK